MSLMDQARMPKLKDKLKELSEAAEKVREELEGEDEKQKVNKISKKYIKRN